MDTHHNHIHKRIRDAEAQKFVFGPDKPLKKQINKLNKLITNNKWDGSLSFKEFKGTFKLEYWMFIEPYLRSLRLKKIKFIDTQLDKKYLDILFNLLLYLQPDTYQIKFKQNELDDLDLQEFTNNVVKFTNLEQLSIISNPGIFKGSFIDKLKFDNMEVIINDGYKSIGIAKKISQKLKDSLCQTYYYELGFDGIFTKENCQAFSYLIQQCYHEDHLEQLQKLSVNDCYLGSSSQFQQDCQDLVTQKGLLEIRLKNQRKIWNDAIVQDLAGDRYDTMRVNVLDISDNQKMTEKAFKIFASKVISNCKFVNLNDSLQQDPTVLAKLISLIESFNSATEIYLEELDISKLENYNRKDLSYKLLKATIFNERSKVKLLKMANCDNKRMESYIEAVENYKGQKCIDVVLSKQQYYLSDELQIKCLEKVIFTPLNDKYQVSNVVFDQCFTIPSRQRGFKEFIRQYSSSKVKFSTKSVKFQNTGYILEQQDLNFFLKTDYFELQEFSIVDQEIEQYFGQFIHQCLEEKWSLTLLKLTIRPSSRIEQFNINKFMKVFLLNPQSKLEYLQLYNFDLFDDPNEKISYLSEELQQTDFKLKLKTLIIDDCNPSFKLFKYGLFTPFSSVENLSLHSIDIQFLSQYQHVRISSLKTISLKEITQSDQIWKTFTSIFLEESQITNIELIEIEINQGFINSFLKNTKDTKLQLKQLSFQQCIFYGDFLSRFLIFQLEQLNIIKCSNFDICIEQLQKSDQLKNFNAQFKIVSITDGKLKHLSWFLEHIIFDVRLQLVEELTLNNMNLESQQLIELGNLIDSLKQYENQQSLKRFYRLRCFNINNNPNLSPYALKYLYDRMLNCSVIIKKEQQENVESKETIQLIQQEQLNLKQKILNNKFKIDPLLIQNLNLALDANESQLSKSQTYFTIIQSLIMAPKSQLETLTISDVDFNLFVEQSSIAYDFANEYCIKYDSTPFILGLKKLKFDKIQNESAEMTLKFLNLYVADSLLQSLDIKNSSHILGQLLNLKLENVFIHFIKSNLIEFYHRDGSEILDQVQTILFINDILLSKRFKIQTLYISHHVDLSFIDISQIDYNSPCYYLQNLEIELFTDSKNNIFRQLRIPLFSGNYVKLKELSITSNYDPNLFIFDQCVSQLEKLSINYLINFDQSFYDFILTNRTTLKYLKFSSIVINQIQLNKPNKINKFPPCELVIQELRKAHSEILFKEFIFSDIFQFNSISEFYYQPLTQLSLNSDYSHIQILKFNFNLLENCTIYMDDTAYKLIGDYFIYNTASKVSEILFDRCNLSLSNCLFLTKSADNVNQLLSLKKFQIYYSFDMGPQGLKYVAEKIWFHPFIKITDIRAEMISLTQEGLEMIINAARQWVQKHHQFQIEVFDIGRNEDCNIPELWISLCDTFIFTDLCPKLHTLYIHFMSLSDPVVKQICLSAQRYLNHKSFRYIHPLRVLNLEYNNNITQKGWSKLFNEVIFHKKMHLEELILNDTDIEYDFVKDAIPKYKTHLHTVFVEDEQLKEALLPYMRDRSVQYVNSFDSVELRQNQDLHNIYKKILSQRYQKIEYFYQESNDLRISPYRLNFQEHFLSLTQQKDMYFSMATLESLTKQFNYSHCRMDPYPLGILLNQDSFNFFKKQESKVQNIYILPSQLAIQDPIEQPYIVYLWEQIKGQNSINQIQIDYLLNDDLVDIMLQKGYTEREIIQLIIVLPPYKIRLQDSLTLQAIKAIYSIFWDTNNFQYANMTYDGNNFLNMGIGYTLRETAYMWRATNPFSKLIKLILYKFCGLFVVDASPYRFDNEVTQLNSYLKTQSISFFLMYIMNIIYYIVCVGGPIYLTLEYDKDQDYDDLCFDGIINYADYLYYAFALLTFIVESYYYYQISKYTPSFLQKIIEIQMEVDDDAENQEMVLNKKKVLSAAQKLSQGLNDAASSNLGKSAALLLAIILSQLAKFAFFNNVKFILQCYYCEYEELYLISAIICGIHVLQSFMNLIILLFERLTSQGLVKQLSTKFINEFFWVSWIGRNLAIAQLLDRIAPYNVTVISNNFLTRFFLPNQAGKSINNSVKVFTFINQNYLFQFIIQDTPQIIIQIFFVISQSERTGTQGWNIYLTVATSAISILVSFRSFMSIRPSIIQQTDFDELAIIKANKRKNYIQKCLEVEKQTILDYTYVDQPQQRVDEEDNLI